MSTQHSCTGTSNSEGRWVHPLCQPLPIERNGPFVEMEDSSLITMDAQGMWTSKDDGKSWQGPQSECQGIVNAKEPASFYILRTKSGALVVVYLDFTTRKFSWNDKIGEPSDDCRLELWAIRSLDGGKTWIDQQRLLDGYNANFFGFIQIRTGRLILGAEHIVRNPGRWVVCSLFSDDDGKTWSRSNLIDLGGHGDHDGAIEPTVAELSDGRLLMLIRTNLGCFWQAFSEDGGRYWRTIQPSEIDASTSPGFLLRLHSGRLVLVWNRLNPEGQIYPRAKPDQHAEVPISWHREELSIAFSEDDGKNWTKPKIIARQREDGQVGYPAVFERQGGQLSYPYIFERHPGEIWVIAGFAFKKNWEEPLPLRLKLNEEEFLRKSNV